MPGSTVSSPARRSCLVLILAALCLAPALSQVAPERLGFAEVWAYLMDGEERFLTPDLPITDIAYVGAGISTYGKLIGVPDRAKLKGYKGRAQLVVSELGSFALTHFCMDPAYPLRDELVADIVRAAGPYDGVQIDFEAVASKDYEPFAAFLSLLKQGLGAKTLSVALPARQSERHDLFGYERVAKIVDRIIVMAYDEHWSQSEPGPVASIEWCQKVAAYAALKVDAAKLVMGLPFYGRAWADKSLSRAYKYSSLLALQAEKGLGEAQREAGIPFLEYSETVNVRLYFDDLASTLARLAVYRSASIRNIAFWRLGQEDPAVWSGIAVDSQSEPQGELTASKPPAESVQLP